LCLIVPRAKASSPVPPTIAHSPAGGRTPITWSVDPLNLFHKYQNVTIFEGMNLRYKNNSR
jgi:hypothetical protein